MQFRVVFFIGNTRSADLSRRVGTNSEKVLRIVALYRKCTRAPTCQNLCLLAVRRAQVLLKATDCMLLLPVCVLCVLCVLCVCVCVCVRERERDEREYIHEYIHECIQGYHYYDHQYRYAACLRVCNKHFSCVYVINILVACT